MLPTVHIIQIAGAKEAADRVASPRARARREAHTRAMERELHGLRLNLIKNERGDSEVSQEMAKLRSSTERSIGQLDARADRMQAEIGRLTTAHSGAASAATIDSLAPIKAAVDALQASCQQLRASGRQADARASKMQARQRGGLTMPAPPFVSSWINGAAHRSYYREQDAGTDRPARHDRRRVGQGPACRAQGRSTDLFSTTFRRVPTANAEG